MKKSIISCMVVGMTLISTTSFGKTNGQPRENNRMNDRMEVRVSNHRTFTDGMKVEPRPGMDKPMPVPEHRHEFGGPEHRCRICGITEHEWHEMMDMHHNPEPMPQPSHFGH